LAFVTVEILDKNGNLCPDADNMINFSTDKDLIIEGVDNGSPISLERFKATHRKAFHGKCLVVVKNVIGKKGIEKLIATSEGLDLSSISLNIR